MREALILETRGLAMAFGGLKVFSGLDFSMRPGERHAVIGPNGAGKSTFVGLLTGLLQPTAGTVWLNGQDITRATPAQRVAAGLARMSTTTISLPRPFIFTKAWFASALMERGIYGEITVIGQWPC